MALETIGQIIERGYTLTLEEFLVEFPDPVLVGVGVLSAGLLENTDRWRNTPILDLDYYASSGSGGDHEVTKIGTIIPIRSKKSPAWTRLTIGRRPENDVVIDDPAVSEIHSYLKRQEAALIIGDFDSTNGTRINGAQLVPPTVHELKDEDIITLGQCSFQFFTPLGLHRFLGLP
jgi:pSer/pThr/pTyr-binding forkhead associated (FHA) protein